MPHNLTYEQGYGSYRRLETLGHWLREACLERADNTAVFTERLGRLERVATDIRRWVKLLAH